MKNENQIKYSNCWEDAVLLIDSLQIDSRSKVMSIASAGDNSLMMLTENPLSMLCLDMNDVQLWLTQLKEEAIRHLSYEAFLQLLGFTECTDRWQIYMTIKNNLSQDAQLFFTSELINNGIIHQGKFEKYFQLFAHRVLPFIHSKKAINKLLEPKSKVAQLVYYNEVWNSLRWKLLFRLFFSKYVMGKLGREPQKLNEVKINVGNRIFNKAENHLSSEACQSNYMLTYALKGKYENTLPPYAELSNFEKIKSWLNPNSISYFSGDLEACIKQYPDYNRFNLSNIFEYMSHEVFERQVRLLLQYSAAKSIYSYWSLMVPRDMDDVANCGRLYRSEQVDRGFFYQEFLNFMK